MRHGESEYNPEHRINFDPKTEVNLTAKGKKQILASAKELKGFRFDVVFASELLRTQESAILFCKGRDLKIQVDKRLNELKSGMEGEISTIYDKLRSESGDITRFKLKGFESFLDAKKRVLDFLEELKKKKYARVMVVTHEAIVQSARAIFGELSDEDALLTKVKNAQYFMFDM